ncbi:Zn-ribbon domain-containing OB-fold protein [Stutzerimonas tarimensis]|uniref:Zn-ribbon domain-containing OB-fold protein n=1 Tax=Stutzerimonas tarimensis TaxID=1507735 RepID=A0ABV7T7X8_9GAMM
MNPLDQIPADLSVAHLLSQDADGLVLRGSRCGRCGEVYFPPVDSCTACCNGEMEPLHLGAEGNLWSWTVQAFMPKSPFNSGETEADFSPYGVGYVEMPCGVKVESRLTSADPAGLRIGMPMKLELVRYGQRADGTPLYTYAFGPAGEL